MRLKSIFLTLRLSSLPQIGKYALDCKGFALYNGRESWETQ